MNTSRNTMLHLRSKKLYVALLVATLATMFAMRTFDGYLTNEICRHGIVSFEFAKTLSCAETILGSWDGQAKIAAGLSLGLDYLFLILYSSTLALLIFRTCEYFAKNKWLRKLGRILIWGVFIAAFFDAIENYALIKLLLGDWQQSWVTTAHIFATMKFVLVGAAIAFLIPTLIAQAFKKKTGDGSHPIAGQKKY